MRIPRIHLNQPLQANQDITLDDRNAHYLGSVLRMKAGMALVVFDGSGMEFAGTITALGKKAAVITLGDSHDPGTEAAVHTCLGIGISRGERMDYIVQKSTELGVSIIQPLFTGRCEVRLDERRASKRRAHWEQVSISACEQSGRTRIPNILAPLYIEQWLDNLDCQYKFILDVNGRTSLSDMPCPDSVALLVGPEGGLSDNEKTLASGKGFSVLSLGPRVLRTETAPVAALALFQYLWGNSANSQ